MNTEKFDAELRAAYECGFRDGYLDTGTVSLPFQYSIGDLREAYFEGVEAGQKARQGLVKVWGCAPPADAKERHP